MHREADARSEVLQEACLSSLPAVSQRGSWRLCAVLASRYGRTLENVLTNITEIPNRLIEKVTHLDVEAGISRRKAK